MNNSTVPFLIPCNIKPTIKEISIAIYLIFIIIASITGNVLVIAASSLSPQLRKRKSIYFVVSLAISDISYNGFVVPLAISRKLNYGFFCHSLTVCFVTQLLDVVFNITSILSLLFIALERYIAIQKPFQYQDIVTTKRVQATLAGIWIFSILWSIAGLFSWGEYITPSDDIWSIHLNSHKYCIRVNNSYYFLISIIGIYMVTLIIISFVYVIILSVAYTQINAIQSTQVNTLNLTQALEDDTTSSPKGSLKSRSTKNSQRKWKVKKEWQATKSVLLVYVFFVLCWFPILLIYVIITIKPSVFMSAAKDVKLLVGYIFIDILPSLNTMMNPIIYSFSNKQFRQGFRKVMNKFCPSFSKDDLSTQPISKQFTEATSLDSRRTHSFSLEASPYHVANGSVKEDMGVSRL